MDSLIFSLQIFSFCDSNSFTSCVCLCVWNSFIIVGFSWQELNETRSRSTIEIEEVDARFADEYESRMKEAIQQMRAENDAVVQATREEAEAYISRQVRP